LLYKLDLETIENNLESAKLTPDGGLILAGNTGDFDLNPHQQKWLVKTDCLVLKYGYKFNNNLSDTFIHIFWCFIFQR